MVCIVAAYFAMTLHAGASFFLDPKGDDANDGRSQAHAWRTLARASKAPLGPGGELILASGATFEGNLQIPPQPAGGSGDLLIIRSSGKPFAHIVSPDKPAIYATTGNVVIRDLILEGQAHQPRKGHDGISIVAKGEHSERLGAVRIESVDVSGFGADGVDIGSSSKSLAGFDEIALRQVVSHDNFDSGISTSDDSSSRALGYAHRNLTIAECTAAHNHSGSGIVVSGVDGGRVEYCRSTENDGKGGGVGTWAWSARHVAFRYCISDGTHTGGGDGGGFDLDGACVDCAMENCLAYENAGPGYMHCDYPYATPTHGNVFRHCVSVNDGRKTPGSEIGFGFVTWGSGLDDCLIERNLAIVTQEAKYPKPYGILFVAYILGSQAKNETPHVRGCTFAGNVGLAECQGVELYHSDMPSTTDRNVRLVGNRFIGGSVGLVGSTLSDVQVLALAKVPYRLTDPHKLPASPIMRFASRL